MKENAIEQKIRQIVESEIRNYLKESTEIKTINYNGQTLSVRNYDISDSNDKEFILKNKEIIWDILQCGYENIGGFKGFRSIKDMIKKSPYYTLGFCNGEIITVSVYNTYLGGNKCVGTSCVKDENHITAVRLLEMIFEYNIANWDEWVWCEASGKIEEMCNNLGAFNVPSNYAIIYLGNKSYSIVDEYHYTRKIEGNDEIKTIFGFKDKQTFDLLSKEIKSKVNAFIDRINSRSIDESDERDRIWAEYANNISEIEKNINIINYFVYLKDDELINEFPIETIHILQDAITIVERLLGENEYSGKEIFRYNNCLEEGYRVLNTSSILAPLNIGA